jgi:hypothetical protein
VQLYRYFVSQSSEFYRHNPLRCFLTSSTKGKRVFRYRLSPETFGYTLVCESVTVTLQLTVGQSVRLGVEPLPGLVTRFSL